MVTTTFHRGLDCDAEFDELFDRLTGSDPLGFEGGDTNLTRYVGNAPTNMTDPTGQLAWDHRVTKEPDIEGALGYSMQVEQTLSVGPGERQATAPAGTQTWQINYAEYFIVMSNGRNSRILTPKRTVMDVNDVGGKPTPLRITDTVALGVRDVAEGQTVVILVEKVTKRLGFRPYDERFRPTGKALEVGNGRALKEGEPEILKDMMGPMLAADTLYIYIDRDACRGASKEDLAKAQEFITKVSGSPLKDLPNSGTYESLTYGNLGAWFAYAGAETSDP